MKNFFLITSLAATFFVFSSQLCSAAQVNANRYFRSQASVILREILNQKNNLNESFNLNRLLEQIPTVQWRWNPKGYLAGSGGARTFAVSFQSPPGVVVNVSAITDVHPGIMPLIALHESLMALGYNDENYAITLILNWFGWRNRPKDQTISQVEEMFINRLKKIKRVSKNRTYQGFEVAEGGATWVGSGGDPEAIEIKRDLIGIILAHRKAINSVDANLEKIPGRILVQRVLSMDLEAWPKDNFLTGEPLCKIENQRTVYFAWPYWNGNLKDEGLMIRQLVPVLERIQ